MKLMDAKGRIFGRINVIDLLVLIVVIAAAVVLVGKLKDNGGSDGGDAMNLRYTVKVYGVEAEVYEALQGIAFPDQLMANGEMLPGQVVSMEAQENEDRVYSVKPGSRPGGLEYIDETAHTYDLTFTIEAHVANNVTNEVGTQEIRVGKSHIVKTRNFELESGVILTCEKLESAS